MKNKHLNSQVILEIICFYLFGFTLLYFALSDRYLKYVTPKTKPYLIFASIVIFIWAASLFRKIYTPQYKKHTAHCLILILPMIAMMIPHNTASSVSSSGSNGFLKGGVTNAGPSQPGNSHNKNNTPDYSSPETENEPPSDQLQDDIADDKSTDKPVENTGGEYVTTDQYGHNITLHGYDEKNRTINISDKDFIGWTNALFLEIDKFIGYRVTVTGSVMKGIDNLSSDEFVPARLVMTCCIADLVPCGLVCRYDKTPQLKTDDWYTVTGVVFKGTFNGQNEPQLMVTDISAAKPIDGYLYPYQ